MAPKGAPGGDAGKTMPVSGLARDGGIGLQELRETFEGWRIFSGDGAWWAIRGGAQPVTGPESLLLPCLTAPGLPGLAERLCLQEWLDGLDPEALATVYQGTMLRSAT